MSSTFVWGILTILAVLIDAQPGSPGSGYAGIGRLFSGSQRVAPITESPNPLASGQQTGAGIGPNQGSGSPLIGGGLSVSGDSSRTSDNVGGGPRVAKSSSIPVVGAGQGLGSGQQIGGGDKFVQVGSGPVPYAGARYGSPQVRRVDSLFTATVTQLVTIDRFVTLTDQAFQSVAVTLTSLTVQTVTAETRGVVQTPVDDRVALQTTVVVRPSTLTLTHVQSDFRIVTETALDYVTITHTSYVIMQTTYTTTATQVLSYTTTLVRTYINTKSIAFTDYRTVTDTVLVPGGRYGYGQA